MSEQKKELDRRLDSIGWGLFLVMIGCLWLVPEETFPDGTWLIGAGAIILVLMGVRILYEIKLNGIWLVIGVIALAFGISSVSGIDIPVFPILIILFGASIIVNILFKKK